jgi:hypothetical protein
MNSAPSEDDLALLRAVLEKAGVEIRAADIGGEGGLVRIGDRMVVFVPLHCAVSHRQTLFIDSIRKLADLLVHIPPRVRQLLGEEDWK